MAPETHPTAPERRSTAPEATQPPRNLVQSPRANSQSFRKGFQCLRKVANRPGTSSNGSGKLPIVPENPPTAPETPPIVPESRQSPRRARQPSRKVRQSPRKPANRPGKAANRSGSLPIVLKHSDKNTFYQIIKKIAYYYGVNFSPYSLKLMAEFQLPFAFRISELLPVARLMRASYLRDQADFVDLLPEDYRPKFLADFDKAIGAVQKVVRSSTSIAQRQLVTQRIEGLVEALPRLLNRLEARVRRAEGLTVAPKKFGIEAVRRDRNDDEHEGLAESLRTLLQNIETNQKALTDKGLTTDEINQLQTLYDNLVADSTTSGSSLSDQRLLTADNVKLFTALYGFLKQLLADGKSLYKDSGDPKLKDYTLRKVLQQVRREQKAAEEAE